jgi:hypothetical protein
METGQSYPTVILDGVTYEVKFTRGLLYKLEKSGITFNPKMTRTGEAISSSCLFSTIVDVLRLAIDYQGTAEELAELAFDQRDSILEILVAGWGKVMLPSLQARVAAKAAKSAATPAERLN